MSSIDMNADRAAYAALNELNNVVLTATAEAGLDPKLVELVKIRVSQINGCAFCLRMHTRDALAQGESTDRLAVLVAWRESQYFTSAEQAALEVAEHVTRGPSDPLRPDASDHAALEPRQASAIAWLAIVMTAWNRLAVTTHTPVRPEPQKRAAP